MISLAFVNLTELKEINLFYSNVVVGVLMWLMFSSWVDVCKQSDPTLWNLLTNGDVGLSNVEYETDNNEEIDSNNYAKQ